MLRVLLIAHANRDDVGEAWVAHQWAARMSERHDVTLLTYRRRDKASAVDQLPKARVVEWVEPVAFGRFERLNSLMKPGWLPFHFHARRWIEHALARGERFDIAHQPVPVAMRYPSPVARLGIPTVIGPVGGSLNSPPAFDTEDTAPWYLKLRALDQWRLRFDPMLRRTYLDAACVVGIAPYVRDTLSPINVKRFELMSETGLEALPEPIDRSAHEPPVRLLFVGRLIRTKGARDAIRALGRLGNRQFVFDIVGDGFDRGACEDLVRELGLGERVTFHGARPRAEIDDFYRRADIFVFPSYREPGGNVVFEAMGSGLPLVVANRGGPGSVVDSSCGIRLDPRSPDQYADELATALARLIDHRDLREQLGRGARRRAETVALWAPKIDSMSELYEQLAR